MGTIRPRWGLLGSVAMVAALQGCGDSGNAESAAAKASERTAATEQPAPCELMTDALLGRHLEFAADATISRSPSKYSPHPLCTVSIPKPNAAELEKAREAAMADYLQRKLRGEDVKLPSLNTNYEVSLTLLQPAESAAQAQANLDSAMAMLARGITGGTEDIEVTIQADVEPVTGVGDKAMWAPRLHQLSLADGPQVFHVTVNTGEGDSADREKAIAIARDLAAAL